ncbi:MAG: amidohydrolase family protein [Gemmataceae bacterium]
MPECHVDRRQFLACAAGAAFASGAAAEEAVPKFIDVHTHMGTDKFGLTVDDYLKWMDKYGVERVCVLPLVSKEAATQLRSPELGFEAAKAHPKRFIPFCAVEPRDEFPGGVKQLVGILERYQERGAKALGEHKVGLPFADPLMMRVYEACATVDLPVLFHMDKIRGTDDDERSGLQRALDKFPKLTFIGHGPGWWGAGLPFLDALMKKYPNIYGDISADSGRTTLGKDMKAGRDFMIRRADRLLFGTDYFLRNHHLETGHFKLLAAMDLPAEVKAKIYRGNAIKLLKLES